MPVFCFFSIYSKSFCFLLVFGGKAVTIRESLQRCANRYEDARTATTIRESLQRCANRYSDSRIATTMCESLRGCVNRYEDARIATTMREPLQRYINHYNNSQINPVIASAAKQSLKSQAHTIKESLRPTLKIASLRSQ